LNKPDRYKLSVYHKLSQQQIDDFFSENAGSHNLNEKLELMEQIREFLFITDAMYTDDIKFVSLKGPLLSYRIYQDAACRKSKDFDLLVGFDLMEKAISVLKGLGFQSSWYEWPTEKNYKQFKGKLRFQFHLAHPEKQYSIELHWKLFAIPPIKQSLIEELINTNLTELEYAGRRFNVLNPEMELLYLIIHGSLHGWRRLKWLVDVHEIVKRGLYNEQKFIDIVRIFKAVRLVALSNEILKIFYPGQPTLPDYGKAPRYLVRHSMEKLEKESDNEYDSFSEAISYFIFIFKAFPGFRYKINTFKYLYYSMSDTGDKRRSFLSLFCLLFRPAKFMKSRFRME
jgi:hypothetical protein